MSELPNFLVREAADQYYSGYEVLESTDANVLAALHCAFIALELYLKSFSSHDYTHQDQVTLSDYIYAEPAKYSHRLEELFDCAPQKFRDAMDSCVKDSADLSRKYKNAREALASYNRMFMGSRYPFDPKNNINGLAISELKSLLQILRTVAGCS